jgi:hypothetical protein
VQGLFPVGADISKEQVPETNWSAPAWRATVMASTIACS